MCGLHGNSLLINFSPVNQRIFVSRCCLKFEENNWSKSYSLDEYEQVIESCTLKEELEKCRNIEPPMWSTETFAGICEAKECKLTKVSVPLERVEVSILQECNLHCRFCGGTRVSHLDREVRNKLVHLYFCTITQLKDFVKVVRMTDSGEPFLFKGPLLSFLNICKGSYLDKIEITTNGTLIDDEIIDAIKNSGLDTFFTVSLNAWDRESYKEIMGQDKFDYVLSVIRKLEQLPGACTTSFVIDDEKNVDNIYNFISQSYFKSVHVHNDRYKPELARFVR